MVNGATQTGKIKDGGGFTRHHPPTLSQHFEYHVR